MPNATYKKFLKKCLRAGSTNVVDIYHAVRNIPYGSTGERDPVKVIASNLGSCSGKHILLRDFCARSDVKPRSSQCSRISIEAFLRILRCLQSCVL